jgi:hypothetical protein
VTQPRHFVCWTSTPSRASGGHLEKLARFKKSGHKIELLYFLASGWLDRSLKGSTRDTDRVERWWGRPDWHALRRMSTWSRAQLVADRFKTELGYTHAFPWPIHKRGRGQGRLMFHMVHATDHPAAPQIMHRAYLNATKTREPMQQIEMDLGAWCRKLVRDSGGEISSTVVGAQHHRFFANVRPAASPCRAARRAVDPAGDGCGGVGHCVWMTCSFSAPAVSRTPIHFRTATPITNREPLALMQEWGARLHILAGFRPREPRGSFVSCDLLSSRLILSPERERVVTWRVGGPAIHGDGVRSLKRVRHVRLPGQSGVIRSR